MENVQKVIIPGQVQTSDGREITLVEKKYFDLPAGFPEVPPGYEEWKGSKTVNYISVFFTEDDYAYVVRQMQYNRQRQMRLFYKWSVLSFTYPDYNDVISIIYSGSRDHISLSLSPEEFLSIPYTEFRRNVLSAFGVYDFVNETEIPKGVSGTFGAAVKALDEAYDEVCGNFLKISALLTSAAVKALDEAYDEVCGNFLKISALLTSIVANTNDFKIFGCKNIFEFAEKRWDYGSTSVKNFLSIGLKFMEGAELLPGYETYSYSQLVELLPVLEDMLHEFNAGMTVAEIRRKKKDLLEAPKEEKEPKPKKESDLDVFKTNLKVFFYSYRIPYDDPASSGYKVYRKALREVVQKLNSEFGLGISTNF